MNKLKTFNLATILIALLTFILGYQLGLRNTVLPAQTYVFPSNKVQSNFTAKDIDFKLFWQTWDLVSKQYVDKKAIDPQKMYYGAIQGMVAALGDPYTVFLPPEAQKSSKEELGGSFEGVGIQLGYDKEKRLVVIAPLQGTPAEKAGVKAGDVILKIDSKETAGLSLPEAVSLIRGPRNTKVALEIFHEGDKKPKDVPLIRDTIVVKSVESEEKKTPSGKKIAYIRLSRFGEKTQSEWEQAVSKALSNDFAGIILDLRNNPGGFLDSAVFIGSEFIESGNIVLQENASGKKVEYKVNRVGKLLTEPLVVLINKGSASASEIVAGAIQDYKRGKLVGTKSFGKGTIQEAEDLPNNTGIHITTAKWLTPDGRWIHNVGLTPDFEVELGEDQSKDDQLNKALEMLD